MRIALTHNLRLTDAVDEAEFDTPETITAISNAIRAAGHEVEPIDVAGPASRLVSRLEAYAPDLIFNTAEGRRGRMRRAFYPGLFAQLGMPSTGSDAYTLGVTLDKSLTKKILTGFGVPSPRGRLVTKETLRAGGLDDLVFPVIVKPNYEGSSKGIDGRSVVDDADELACRVEDLLTAYPEGVLVERFVSGADLAVCFLEGLPKSAGGPVMAPVLYVVHPSYRARYNVHDYELKHRSRAFVELKTPAPLDAPIIERARTIAERALAALRVRDAAKVDLRLGADGQIWFLSITALPTYDPAGALVASTAAVGLGYADTVMSTLRSAAARAGLSAALEAGRPRKPGKRTSLKVGLAFNMKRTDTSADDREAEYDSPRTIEAITRAIESHGHQVVPLEATGDFPRALLTSGIDLLFNVAEGIRGRNREAQVPSLCELLGIPYTGSDSATLSLCLDKGLGKRLLRAQGVDTPQFQVLLTGREKLRSLRYPVIVKPNAEGTSKGISPKSVVDDEAGVRRAARELIERYDQPALVEEYVHGREFTVGLLGERRPRVLPPMEVLFLNATERPVYDYQCKQDWQTHVRYECPARLTKEEERSIEKVCRATFDTLGCRDVARIDLRIDRNGRVWVLEVNPLPGLTPDYSDLCLIANGARMDYRTLIGEILACGIKRWREREEHRPRATARLSPVGAPGAATSDGARGAHADATGKAPADAAQKVPAEPPASGREPSAAAASAEGAATHASAEGAATHASAEGAATHASAEGAPAGAASATRAVAGATVQTP